MAKISFVIQGMDIRSDVKTIKDKDGFYTIPGYVFDKPSRNGKLYDTPHFVNCLTDPNARINRMLVERCLHGESGHPKTTDFDRLCTILETNYAVFYDKLWTGQLKSGETVLWTRLKPVLPNGGWFEQALEDPKRNVSLSIRAACQPGPQRDGYKVLYPKILVTLDAVGGGGYGEASKISAMNNIDMVQVGECWYQEFDESVLTDDVARMVFCEDYNKESLLDHFRAESITMTKELITIDTEDPNYRATSFFKCFMK